MEKELSKIHEFVNSFGKDELAGQKQSLLFATQENPYGKATNTVSCQKQ